MFAEITCGFALFFGVGRQVEEHQKPHDTVFAETIHLHLRVNYPTAFAREATRKRGCRLAGSHHKRAALPVDVHFKGGYGEQSAFDGGGYFYIAA